MPLDQQDQIAHLLRRGGFAARPEEIEAGVARGLGATVDQLLNFETTPDNLAPPPPGLDDPGTFGFGTYTPKVVVWWLNAMIQTTRPLQEKMVLFWHGLFATSARNVQDERQMLLQNQLFRGNFNPDRNDRSASPFPMGDFRLILEWLTKDPAMSFYLDNWLNSRKDNEVGTNENYARELHELFSMGVEDVVAKVPNYTERDIRQASRALTGWSVAPWNQEQPRNSFARWFAYQPNFGGFRVFHDPGPYQHLGVTFRSGDGRLGQLFNNIVNHKNPGQRQSATGRFLGFRLFKFFGHDNPEPEIINALADVFDTGTPQYNIKNMLRTMFTPGNLVSEAFYSERAFKAHVKSPAEYVVSSFRLLKPTGIDNHRLVDLVPRYMSQMGQRLFDPPDVSGWKEGLRWINTTFDLARFNFANEFMNLGADPGGIHNSYVIFRQPQSVVNLKGNTQYTLSFWAKGRGEAANLIVLNDYSFIAYGEVVTLNDSWQNVQITFRTPAVVNNIHEMIRFAGTGNSAGRQASYWALIDDVRITDNLLRNPGFERFNNPSGVADDWEFIPAGWVATTSPSTDAREGSRSQRIDLISRGGIETADLRTTLIQNGAQTPEQIVDYFTTLLLQMDVSPETRRTLVNYLMARDDGTPGPFVLSDETINKKIRGLLRLIMSSPEYQVS